MTPEELAAKEAADAKAKKTDGFLDKLADKIMAKQEAKTKAGTPPARDVRKDPILDSTVTGDEDLDEFMFGEKPAKPTNPAEGGTP